MTAREHQAQAIVGDGDRIGGKLLGLVQLADAETRRPQLLRDLAQLHAPADRVDRLVARDLGQPRARLVGGAFERPARERVGERVLDDLLGEIEVAVRHADRRGEYARAFAAEHVLDRGGRRGAHRASLDHIPWIGRISIEPNFALGIRAATARASSRSLALIK